MDLNADRDEATVAVLLANLTSVIMNTIAQKNAIIKNLQEQLKTPAELEDK